MQNYRLLINSSYLATILNKSYIYSKDTLSLNGTTFYSILTANFNMSKIIYKDVLILLGMK